MKSLLCFMLAASVAFATPPSSDRARARALVKYPGLSIEGSAINVAFVARVKELEKTSPEVFKDPEWPTAIADECADKILAPVRKAQEEQAAKREAAVRSAQDAAAIDKYSFNTVITPFIFNTHWVMAHASGSDESIVVDGDFPSIGKGSVVWVKMWRIGFTKDSSRDPLFTTRPERAIEYFKEHPPQ